MPLPCKTFLTDYTAEEIDLHFQEHGVAQVLNSEDPKRGSFLSILATGADKMPERAFSEAISL
jgi:hypothetical protein